MANAQRVFMHEVKNCLSNIYSLVDLIDQDPTADSKEYFKLIKESIMQIKSLEEEYDIYRKSGKISVKLSTLDVEKSLNDLASEYKVQAETANVLLIIDCPGVKIKTDAVKFRQVFRNLISNAIKYNKPYGLVLVEAKIRENHVEILVKDTGIGMNSDELKKVGTPFYRGKRNSSAGTGLGLSTVKQICNQLGWKMTIFSKYPVDTAGNLRKSLMNNKAYSTIITIKI